MAEFEFWPFWALVWGSDFDGSQRQVTGCSRVTWKADSVTTPSITLLTGFVVLRLVSPQVSSLVASLSMSTLYFLLDIYTTLGLKQISPNLLQMEYWNHESCISINFAFSNGTDKYTWFINMQPVCVLKDSTLRNSVLSCIALWIHPSPLLSLLIGAWRDTCFHAPEPWDKLCWLEC